MSTTLSSQFVVVIFYWGLSANINYNLDNVIRHGAGPVCLLVEHFGARIPVSSSSLPYVIGFPSLYLIWMSLRARATGDWVYEQLNPSQPGAVTYYFFLVILILMSYTCVYYLALLREHLLARRERGERKEGR